MAKLTIGSLTELTTPEDNDILLISDVSAGADRKIQVSNLVGGGIVKGVVNGLTLVGSSDTVDNNWQGLPASWSVCLLWFYEFGTRDHPGNDLLTYSSEYAKGTVPLVNDATNDPMLVSLGYWPILHTAQELDNWYNSNPVQWKAEPIPSGINFKNLTNSGNVDVSFTYLAW